MGCLLRPGRRCAAKISAAGRCFGIDWMWNRPPYRLGHDPAALNGRGIPEVVSTSGLHSLKLRSWLSPCFDLFVLAGCICRRWMLGAPLGRAKSRKCCESRCDRLCMLMINPSSKVAHSPIIRIRCLNMSSHTGQQPLASSRTVCPCADPSARVRRLAHP